LCLKTCADGPLASDVRTAFSGIVPPEREANFHPRVRLRRNGEISNRRCRNMRVKITLACTECKRRNYVSKKNKKNDPDRIEMMKHCRFCNKHTLHKETK